MFYFTSSMLKMFLTLIHPSSGACDVSIESSHWSCVLVSMFVGVSVWLGVEHRRSEIKHNNKWHQVGVFFFKYFIILWKCYVNSFNFKNICNLARHKCQTLWWWNRNIEICRGIYYVIDIVVIYRVVILIVHCWL